MLENYAAHGMYIKFTDEEASALEREALDVALAASAADAGCWGFYYLTLTFNLLHQEEKPCACWPRTTELILRTVSLYLPGLDARP